MTRVGLRSKSSSLVGASFACGLLLFLFQNCSPGMQSSSISSLNSAQMDMLDMSSLTPGQKISLNVDQTLSYLSLPPSNGREVQLYVDPRTGLDSNTGTIDKPLKTIAGAKTRVRTLLSVAKGHIIVNFRTGRYELADTLVFTSEDSGPAPYAVIYQSYPGERAVVSGGVRESANRLAWAAVGNGVYRTNIGAKRPIRQLYNKNRLLPRARGRLLTQPSFQLTTQGITLPSYAGAIWSSPKTMEVAILFGWRMFRCPIDQVSDAHFVFESKCLQNVTGLAMNLEVANSKNLSAVWIENAPELITQPEEWTYDYSTGDFFFKPRNSADLSSTEFVFTFPRHMHLLRIDGETKPVSNVVFRDLEFSHSAWMGPSEVGGYSSFFAGYHKLKDSSERSLPLYLEQRSGPFEPLLYRIPAAIELRGATKTAFIHNKMQFLGGSGILVGAGSKDNWIAFNQFLHIAATGLQVGLINGVATVPDNDRVRDNIVEGNEFSRVARDYYDNVGIFVGYTEGTQVVRNHLFGLPYSGITIGYNSLAHPTTSRDVRISQNYVHDVMTWLADGGGVYTLGFHSNSVIESNQIRDIVFSPFYTSTLPFVSGLYFDNGTRGFFVTNNQVLNIEHNMWLLDYCRTNFGSSCPGNYFLNRSIIMGEPLATGMPTIDSNNVYGNYRALASGVSPLGAVKVDYGVQTAYRDILKREPSSVEGMQYTQELMYGRVTLAGIRQKIAESSEAISLIRRTLGSDAQVAMAQAQLTRTGSQETLSELMAEYNATSALGIPEASLLVNGGTSYIGSANSSLEFRWYALRSGFVDMRATLTNASSNCELPSYENRSWLEGGLPDGDRQLIHFGPEYRSCDLTICAVATNPNGASQSCVRLQFH